MVVRRVQRRLVSVDLKKREALYFRRPSLLLICRGGTDMCPMENWVNITEVAAHLQVTKDSIYRWVDAKGFPAHRAGRLLRFKLSEVDEWVRSGGDEHTPLDGHGRSADDN